MEPLGSPREMTTFERIVDSVVRNTIQFRRRYIPYMIFYGQEVDTRVTWKENKLRPNSSFQDAQRLLNSGRLHEIERMIGEIGISFDKGLGFEGRDWEWDWSLNGPISVVFRGKCKTTEKRE